MQFQGQYYVLNQVEGELWHFIHGSKPGEYTHYYDKIIFNTGKGFVAAYANDLDNCWSV